VGLWEWGCIYITLHLPISPVQVVDHCQQCLYLLVQIRHNTDNNSLKIINTACSPPGSSLSTLIFFTALPPDTSGFWAGIKQCGLYTLWRRGWEIPTKLPILSLSSILFSLTIFPLGGSSSPATVPDKSTYTAIVINLQLITITWESGQKFQLQLIRYINTGEHAHLQRWLSHRLEVQWVPAINMPTRIGTFQCL